MARATLKAVLEDRQDPAAPYLFDDSQMPVALPVLEAVRDRRYEHRGRRLLEDEERALRLVELLCHRWGVKRISREMNISAHTVRAARRALMLQGKLAPYKQRVVEIMEDAIEAGVEKYRDEMEEGRISAAQIPVGIGILFDKRALAMGEPTSISMSQGVEDAGPSVEAINAYLEQLPMAGSVATKDSESFVSVNKTQQIEAASVLDDTLDATKSQPSPDGRTAGSDRGRPDQEVVGLAQPPDGPTGGRERGDAPGQAGGGASGGGGMD